MNVPKLPSVRLSAICGGEPVIEDSYVLEPAPSNRLIVSYAPETRSTAPVAGPSSFDRPSTSSEGEPQSSEGDSGNDDSPNDEDGDSFLTGEAPESSNKVPPRPRMGIPQLSRTLSMPLPSQLTQLNHPHRPGPASRPNSFAATSQFRDLSFELADSIQMAIQTMLQISPPQVLDSAKEQLSACSLSVPTSSMSAVFTTMKNLNYISANMAAFAGESPTLSLAEELSLTGTSSPSENVEVFDIGEMLQCVGDALSGAAAQAGVDLVLYHGDAGLKHVYVLGDESGISYVLSHVLRQVLNTAAPGDSIELGLLISQVDSLVADPNSALPSEVPDSEDDPIVSSPVDVDTPLKCSFRIVHKFAPMDFSQGEADAPGSGSPPHRPEPTFNTLLLRRLLRQVWATLVPQLPLGDGSRLCELSVTLERGVVPAPAEAAPDDSGEPSLDQLGAFVETLKGKRGTLYASPKGSFAQHLTSYLTAWGMDVSHVSPDGNIDGLADSAAENLPLAPTNPTVPVLSTYGANTDAIPTSGIPAKIESRHARPEQPSFIFIDDDVNILQERLYALHAEQQPIPPTMRSKRPTLASHHRKSSPQITRLLGHAAAPRPPPAVIIHFTSLSNYRIVRDAIQSVMVIYAASSTPLPEVMILPKPAGPRRFLTALHTAVTKPTIDPFFSPIATSPMSPGVQLNGSFFRSYADSSPHASSHAPSLASNRPGGSRSNSDRSTKSSGKEPIEHVPAQPPSSPLGLSDNVEYFSEAAMRLGSSPSSGLVIQSPDGQPAGIFFHPRGKTSRNPSNQSVDREKGPFLIPSRRGSTSRNPSAGNGEVLTFSSLHALPGGRSPMPRPPPQIAVDSPPASSPGSRTPARKPSEVSTSAIASASTFSRRGTLDASRKLSPPVSPNETGVPSRRVPGRRPEPTITTSVATKKAGPGDGKVIPPISVLIVDDNIINQTILSTFMRKKKIKYDIAKNGLEAVQKWRTGGFHLILMDIQMPVMDGIEATKEIRRLERSNALAGYPPLTPSEGARTPPVRTPSETSSAGGSTDTTRSTASPYRSSVIIVALTASSLQSDRVAALAAGCNDFLTKPVSLLWLNNKIIEWGSIKALQMWDSVRTISNAQARTVAERLHVPQGRGTPSPSRGSPSNEDVSPVGGPAPMSAPISSSALASGGALPASVASVTWTPAQSPSRLRGPISPSRSNSTDGPSIIVASSSKPGVSDPKADADMLDANDAPKSNGTAKHDSVESQSDSQTPAAPSSSTPSTEVVHIPEPVHTRENGLKHESSSTDHPPFPSPATPARSLWP